MAAGPGEAAVAGAAEDDGAVDAEGFAEAFAEALADGLAAAVAGRQIRVSWPYFAKTESLMTDGWFGPSRSAAFCGPILAMSGT